MASKKKITGNVVEYLSKNRTYFDINSRSPKEVAYGFYLHTYEKLSSLPPDFAKLITVFRKNPALFDKLTTKELEDGLYTLYTSTLKKTDFETALTDSFGALTEVLKTHLAQLELASELAPMPVLPASAIEANEIIGPVSLLKSKP